MSYRVGYPFWKAIARNQVPVSFRVEICRDEEAGVYIASSPDLKGLVVEAETLDELRVEIRNVTMDLMDIALHGQPAEAVPRLSFVDSAVHAAA